MTFERPAVERYLRLDVDLPDGGCIDIGLEDKEEPESATRVVMLALERCLEVATEDMAHAKAIGIRLEGLLNEWFPGRYWFAEIWTPSGAVKRYQVIQPAVVGGFKR